MGDAPEVRLGYDRIPEFPDYAKRREWIVDLMAMGRWPPPGPRRAEFVELCAERWGVTVRAVGHDAQIASEHLRMLGHRERVLRLCRTRYERFSRENGADRLPATLALEKSVGRMSAVPLTNEQVRARFVEMIQEPSKEVIEALREAFRTSKSEELRTLIKEAHDALCQ